MTETLIFDGYDAYLTLIETALTPSGFVVFDGPQATMPTDKKMVLVGVDEPRVGDGGMSLAVDAGTQEWESLGAYSRMETFTILSTMVVWTGDNDLAGCRAVAKAGINIIGVALRPAPYGSGDAMLGNVLNQNGGGTGWCGLAVTRLQQISDPAGVALHVQFALACNARI